MAEWGVWFLFGFFFPHTGLNMGENNVLFFPVLEVRKVETLTRLDINVMGHNI